KGQSVKVCSVVDFPLGAGTFDGKRFEAEQAIEAGAAELDMVMSTGLFLSGRCKDVHSEIEVVARTTHAAGCTLKVIIETGILGSDDNIMNACRLCAEGEADFVKTCTGFTPGHAAVEHVRLMKESVPPHVQVKASGG